MSRFCRNREEEREREAEGKREDEKKRKKVSPLFADIESRGTRYVHYVMARQESLPAMLNIHYLDWVERYVTFG